ncbi:MAG: KamA family radical SAM protein [Spirochaetales bacterium]|nr:KamA family radical SAM protein [Spirochaetales bacterium]
MKTGILTNIHNLPAGLKGLCTGFPELDPDPEFPFRLTEVWAMKIKKAGDPLFIQAIPSRFERDRLPSESNDPLAEERFMVSPGLVHRYPDRVLLLLTDNCDMHCRHCFRRSFSGKGGGTLNQAELEAAAAYVRAHEEVHEIIYSGGDPLTLDPAVLEGCFTAMHFPGRNMVRRIGTRVPVVSPGRINDRLLNVLTKQKPLWTMLQINHPDELCQESLRALAALREAGAVLLNQTVLIDKVNDDPEILKRLCHILVENGIKPYYVFQGDLAGGTSHLRVPLKKGWEIMKQLRRKVSGIALPVFAVDLPGGGGKIPLTESYFIREDAEGLVFTSPEGGEYCYPVEE